MKAETTSRQFFDSKYEKNADPWNFATNGYELDRYAKTMKSISGRRYKRAFEPGCSIGVLTESLASICDQVHAMDISVFALDVARQRNSRFSNIIFNCGTLPDDVPDGLFDLIVFSEIGYYFNEEQLRQLFKKIIRQVEQDGCVVGIHWLGQSEDHVLTGDRVHEILNTVEGLRLEQSERHAAFRLDRWSRT